MKRGETLLLRGRFEFAFTMGRSIDSPIRVAANKPEYWNVGIMEYWERATTKSLEMRAPQDGFLL
jgi:hypothetical protein